MRALAPASSLALTALAYLFAVSVIAASSPVPPPPPPPPPVVVAGFVRVDAPVGFPVVVLGEPVVVVARCDVAAAK